MDVPRSMLVGRSSRIDFRSFQQASLDMRTRFMDKLQEQRSAHLPAALDFPGGAVEAAKGVLRGIGFAVWGVVSALQNPRLMKDYTQFAKSMGVVLLALYSAAIVLLFFALPIVVFVPGLALQLLALIPYWAISITKSRSPVSTNLLFFVRSSSLHVHLRLSPFRSIP